MKTIFIIFLLFFAFFSKPTFPPPMKLDFILGITQKEASKDSHSINETWNLKENTLNYSLRYGGRLSNRKSISKSKVLKKEQIESLEKILTDKKLYQNIPSPKYNDFATPYRAIHVNLSIRNENESYTIDLYELENEMPQVSIYQDILVLKDALNAYF